MDVNWILLIGIVLTTVIVLIVSTFISNKNSKSVSSHLNEVQNRVQLELENFIDEIIVDYCDEYKYNYLAIRYDLEEYYSENSYVFKTKKIGTLSSVLSEEHVKLGSEVLNEIILKKYNVSVPEAHKLPFIIETSRIEGKVKAVESVKNSLPHDDANSLSMELQEDIQHLIKKYTR